MNCWKLLVCPLLLISLSLHAGELRQVHFNVTDNTVVIAHNGCQATKPLREAHKLIIPLQHCTANTGEILVSDDSLWRVHWAQHDSQLVWVVLSFQHDYQFELRYLPGHYEVCLSDCPADIAEPDPDSNTLNALSLSRNALFVLHGIRFIIPLPQLSIEQFLDRSIGHIPKDIIRDGLPHFGSLRGDWLGKPRMHRGYDIYINHTDVKAAADGKVIRVTKGGLSGLYVKLDHGSGIHTLYIHLTATAALQEGDSVSQGQVIGRIDGPSGNAIAPQLHFELKVNNVSIDPLPLIEHFYRNDNALLQRIQQYKRRLDKATEQRQKLLQTYMQSRQQQ